MNINFTNCSPEKNTLTMETLRKAKKILSEQGAVHPVGKVYATIIKGIVYVHDERDNLLFVAPEKEYEQMMKENGI
jgi:hypothetical protein